MKSLQECAQSALSQFSQLEIQTNEANADILKYAYSVFPYEWQAFVKLVMSENIHINVHIDADNDDELLVNSTSKSIIARFDKDDNKVYTDITKRDFHPAVQSKKLNTVQQYINETQELGVGSAVRIATGKHAGKTGKIEMLLAQSAIVDIEKGRSTEELLNNIKLI